MLIFWLMWQVLSFILIIFAALLALPVIGWIVWGVTWAFGICMALALLSLLTKTGRAEFMRGFHN